MCRCKKLFAFTNQCISGHRWLHAQRWQVHDQRLFLKMWPICNDIKKLESTCLRPQMETRSLADKHFTKRPLSTRAVLMTIFSFKCYSGMWKDWTQGQRENDLIHNSSLVTCTNSWREKQQESNLFVSTLFAWHHQRTGSSACVERHVSTCWFQLPFNHFKVLPTLTVTPHGSTSWQMSRGSCNDHSNLLLLLGNQPRAAVYDSKEQVWLALGVPQIFGLNNHSWSWSGNFWWNDFLLKEKLVKQNLSAEIYQLWWNVSAGRLLNLDFLVMKAWCWGRKTHCGIFK